MRTINVNEISLKIVDRLLECPEEFGVAVTKLNNGGMILDCGVNAPGGYEVGRLVIEVCLGGLGKATLTMMQFEDVTLPAVTVTTDSPAIATLGIQAGYPMFAKKELGATCSGPARVLARKPKELFDVLNVHDDSKVGVIVLQMDELPSTKMCEDIAAACHVDPKSLFMLITPLRSMTGVTQIAGRAIEDVTFTMWEILHYDVRKIEQMIGTAPIAPVCKSGEMKTFPDDFLCYGGTVYMTIESDGEDLGKLATKLVFESTQIYGKTFSQSLKRAEYDFKAIPGYPGIFRPARIVINDLKMGRIHQAGEIDPSMIRKCLGLSSLKRPSRPVVSSKL